MFLKAFKSQLKKDLPIKIAGDELSILVEVKRSSKAKNIRLSISANNEAYVTLPIFAEYITAVNFVKAHESWLRKKIIPPKIELKDKIHILGQEYLIKYNQQDSQELIKIINNEIWLSSTIVDLDRLMMLKFKKLAYDEIKTLVDKYANILGVKYSKINIRDTKTRWGSCSSSKALSFSWRLILAPIDVMEYVIVHEVCHLKEMNHSEKFWRLVFQLYPNYFDAKLWIKRNGKSLFFK